VGEQLLRVRKIAGVGRSFRSEIAELKIDLAELASLIEA
jgi:hypothetical protein